MDHIWAGEMAQHAEVAATKPDNLSLILENHIHEQTHTSCSLISTHILWHTYMYTYRINKCNGIIKQTNE